MPIREGLAEYALISAFRDSRFRKIDKSELATLECGYVLKFHFLGSRFLATDQKEYLKSNIDNYSLFFLSTPPLIPLCNAHIDSLIMCWLLSPPFISQQSVLAYQF